MYTGYLVSLVAALMFLWTQNPDDLKVLPLAQLFVKTAQISSKLEESEKAKPSSKVKKDSSSKSLSPWERDLG